MKLLIIIVSYNFERWMDRCLGSLCQSELPADVLVVDNASQDHTVQRIKKHYPQVQLIQSKENLGFGRANNIGMKIALEEGYEAVFLLNQDAWIDKNTLGTLVQLSRQQPAFGILSPTHLTSGGNELEHGFACYAGLKNLKELKKSTIPRHEGSDEDKLLTPIPFINAAFWLIPVPVLQQIGGFCPLFYHYGEDVDYIHRLHRHGYRAGYSPAVFGCHDREHREVTRQAWFRSERVYLLAEYANINYPFYKAFGYGILAGIKKAGKALLQRDSHGCLTYLRIALHLLGRTREVIDYRRKNLHGKGTAIYLTD